jgi:NADH:ubiquinone oxidoreductase subunit 2 (subunit N)
VANERVLHRTDHFVLLPAIMLALFGCAVLLFDFLFPRKVQRKWLLLFAVGESASPGVALWRSTCASRSTASSRVQRRLVVDGFSLLQLDLPDRLRGRRADLLPYLEIEGEHHGEYYGLLLLAKCGMFFLATGTDLVTLFIGLELMALCFYIMVGFLRRDDRRSNEAALKYLLLGGFSSGFLAVRLLAAVRHLRLHQAGATSAAAVANAAALGPHRVPRHRHRRRRAAVQDLRRALPHVGAGRLRRRADSRSPRIWR